MAGLSGTLPSEVGRLTNMSAFFVHENGMFYCTEVVPEGWCFWTHVHAVLVSHISVLVVEFSAALPTELGQLTLLERMALRNNNFSSSLPTEIGLMEALYEVKYNVNGKTFIVSLGPLCFWLLMTLVLTSKLFWWYCVEFSGRIPSEFGQLSKLEILGLSENLLTGEIPDEMESLAITRGGGVLQEFNITGNPGLTGTIAEGFCRLLDPNLLEYDCSPTDALCGCDDCPCLNISNTSLLVGSIVNNNNGTSLVLP